MIISEADATWAADKFIDYFKNFVSIEDYLRYVKKELVCQSNQLTPLKDYFFNEDIPPEQIKAGYWVDFEKEREYLAYRDRL